MHDVEASALLDQFGRDVQRGADAVGAHVQFARLGARQVDQLGGIGRRQRSLADQHEGGHGDAGQRREVLQRIVFDGRRRYQRCDVDGAGHREQQCVAVGRCARRFERTDGAGRSGHVVDHHRLLELVCQLRHDQAGRRVDASARRKRHNDGDGLGREVLRLRECRATDPDRSQRLEKCTRSKHVQLLDQLERTTPLACYYTCYDEL